MNKILFPILLSSLLVLTIGCSKEGYESVVSPTEDFVEATNEYLAELDNTKDSSQVAAAINSYADKIEKIMPKMYEISKKFPELSNNSSELPAELKKVREEAAEVGKKFTKSFAKLAPYMQDPKVMEAQMRLSKVMMKN